MKAIDPYIEVEADELDRKKLLKLEKAARTCYKSEVTNDPEFIKRMVKRGHESVLEHEKITVRIICDRGVTHEIVRHRVGSYSQESTRYCNYANDKFGGELTFIRPFGMECPGFWEAQMELLEGAYLLLVDAEPKETPEWARSVLPNSLKTEIVVTYNMREWRHFFKLRCDKAAHPQIRQIAIPLLLKFREVYPELFSDVPYDEKFDAKDYAEVKIVE